MENTRKTYIDVVRGIVIILMIIGHTDCNAKVLHGIFGFHMPFFFILSGMLYDNNKWQKEGITSLIKKRWKAYVVPYFILSFINLLINIPVEMSIDNLHGEALWVSTVKHIYWIFYSSGLWYKNPNCTPLWFLVTLFLSTIYFYCLLKVKKTSARVVICVFAMTLDFYLKLFNVVLLPWHMEVALVGMVFMYIGYAIKEKNLVDKLSLEGGYAFFFLMVGYYCTFTNPRVDLNNNIMNNIILMMVGSVCVSLALIILVKKYLYKNRILEFYGKNTYIFMAFNFAINRYVKWLWYRLPALKDYNYTWWMCLLINMVILTLVCCLWRVILRFWKK